MSQVRLVCILLLSLLAGVVRAEERPATALAGESRAAAVLLEEARKTIAEQNWPEATTQLQTLIENHADDLVSVGPRQLLPARRQAHALMARHQGQVLELYRTRTDPQARRWLEQGLEEREPRWLRKVVDEAFCSRPAEKALDALGDLAFERGDFNEAEAWYERLLPAGSDAPPGALHYPAAEIEPARVQAKLLLTRLFRDGPTSVKADLAGYRKQFSEREGWLAGKRGKYGDILQELAKQKYEPDPDRPWATLGGDATRGLVMPAPANLTDRLGALCREPRAEYNLEDRQRLERPPNDSFLRALANRRGGTAVTKTKAARQLAFEPVIAAGQVLWCDTRHVIGCDLRTGSCVEWYDAARHNGGFAANLSLPAPADLRCTLTVAEGCVFARLGEQTIGRPPEKGQQPAKPAPRAESLLVCLGLEPGPGGDRLRWQARPAVANDNAVFEGAPVVHAGHVCIAATRYAGDQAITAIHCYPTGGGAQVGTPPLRWRKDVCEVRETRDEKRYRHQLLTLAGPNLVYCAHNGVIVALDAVSGRRAWAARYPARPAPTRPDEEVPLTDLSPCLFAAGRVYAAPNDSDRLLCLEASSGQLLWEQRIDVVHLLGVSRVKETPLLIFTTPTGLKAINALDGSEDGGWAHPDGGGKVPPMGRGLLVGDVVLWPTPTEVFAIRQADGHIAAERTMLERIPSGNMAFGEGCLAVADRTRLTVFVPPALLLKEGEGPKPEPAQTAIPREPDSRAVRELARALANAAGGEPPAPPAMPLIRSPVGQASRLPVGVPPLGGLPAEDRLKAELQRGGFQLDSGRLYCMQGERRLLAFDAETGRLLWERWAPGGMLGDAVPEGRFLGGYRVFDKTLLVQTGTGRRWLLDAASGRCLQDAPADRQAWPVVSGDGRAANLCLIREGEKIVRLNANYGKDVWSWALPGPSQRTGEPVQIHVSGDSVLVLTPTNLGLQLQRLNADTGAALWSKPPYLATERLDLSGCSVDEQALYLVRDQTLTALSLQDGRALWEKPISGPQGTWKTLLLRGPGRGIEPVRATPETLLVYPDQVPARRWGFCWTWGSVQWIVRNAPEGRPGQGCPIHCVDPGTGQLIQRLNLPAGPATLMRSEQENGREEFALHPSIRASQVLTPSGLTVRVGAKGLVVGLGGRVWGYDSLKGQ